MVDRTGRATVVWAAGTAAAATTAVINKIFVVCAAGTAAAATTNY